MPFVDRTNMSSREIMPGVRFHMASGERIMLCLFELAAGA